MKKSLYIIESNTLIAKDTLRIILRTDNQDVIHSGQFVNIGIDGKYLRRPISVCDIKGNRLTLIYKVVGKGTEIMSKMFAGQQLELLSPLGSGFSPDSCQKSALLVGGGLGAAPLFLLCKELISIGKKVSAVLGFNRAADIVLIDEYRSLGIEPVIATLDGSAGIKGLVTDAIALTAPEYDFFYCCGPMTMMKAVCQALPTQGEASLEERMGCGSGFCYGCSCKTASGIKTVCKDGPVFKKEDILW